MADDRMQISWDDLNAPAVEEKLKQQEAVSGTQSHYEATEISVPQRTRRFAWLYSATIYLSLFGALGGLLGWGFGEVLHYHKDLKGQAKVLAAQYSDVQDHEKKISATPAEMEKALAPVMRAGKDNPYFKIFADSSLSEDEQAKRTLALDAGERHRDFIADLLFYGISGIAIAMLLAAADAVMERNINGAILYGTIGAIVGAAGGLVVALIDFQITQQLTPDTEIKSFLLGEVTNAISWGLLGLFLAAAPGIILRNSKRLLIGVIGGVIGGVVGGLLFDPVEQWTGNPHMGRLVAIVCIGLLTGLFSGIIENAVKAGWLKVEAGLIAGKQFVLYRNPTFIGSHPMSHIYLFNDPHIGKRHACVHIVGNGYEIEDLPLGTRTYVNDKPVTRARLHNGDVVQVGGTIFRFQEKAKTV